MQLGSGGAVLVTIILAIVMATARTAYRTRRHRGKKLSAMLGRSR